MQALSIMEDRITSWLLYDVVNNFLIDNKKVSGESASFANKLQTTHAASHTVTVCFLILYVAVFLN